MIASAMSGDRAVPGSPNERLNHQQNRCEAREAPRNRLVKPSYSLQDKETMLLVYQQAPNGMVINNGSNRFGSICSIS